MKDDLRAVEYYMLAAYLSLIIMLIGLAMGIMSGDYKIAYLGLGFFFLILIINSLQGVYYIIKEEIEDLRDKNDKR